MVVTSGALLTLAVVGSSMWDEYLMSLFPSRCSGSSIGYCLNCTRGTYNTRKGQDCALCPNSSTTLQSGSSFITSCVCSPGFSTLSNMTYAVEACSVRDTPVLCRDHAAGLSTSDTCTCCSRLINVLVPACAAVSTLHRVSREWPVGVRCGALLPYLDPADDRAAVFSPDRVCWWPQQHLHEGVHRLFVR